jgi:hypothetical protein
MKKIKAYAIVWEDQADKSKRIDYADAHTYNDCPCVDPTDAMAIYFTKKDAINKKKSSKEYKIVPCEIIIKI